VDEVPVTPTDPQMLRARALSWSAARAAEADTTGRLLVADWLGVAAGRLDAVPSDVLDAITAQMDGDGAWIDGLRRQLLLHTRDRVALFDQQARTDSLTRIANRRALDERLLVEMRRTRRYGRPLSIILGDVDGFKAVNDTLGHAAGDAFLRTLARRLQGAVRQTDLVGRWGGDEFAAVCRETDLAAAARLGRKLADIVSGTPIPLPGGARAAAVSAGWACAHDPWSVDELVRDADASLYRACAWPALEAVPPLRGVAVISARPERWSWEEEREGVRHRPAA
jgi:diguanylate cyclase (GGDEF)-like protein